MTTRDIDTAVDEYVGELGRQGKTAGTRETYRRTLDRFCAYCEAVGVWNPADVTLATVRRYLDRRGHLAEATLAAEITHLTGFFRFLDGEGRLRENPMRRVKRPRVKPSEDLDVVTVSTGEAERLLAGCETWPELLCVSVLLYLGPRRRALATARRRDLDLDRGTLRFREKGGKTARKPLPAELEAILRAADENHVWASGDDYLVPSVRPPRARERDDAVVYNLVRRVAGRAGVVAHTHALRAAFAVHYLEQHPGDREALQYLMGHRRADTTQIYLRRQDKHVAMERVRDVSWSSPVFPQTEVGTASGSITPSGETGLPEPIRRKLAELRDATKGAGRARR